MLAKILFTKIQEAAVYWSTHSVVEIHSMTESEPDAEISSFAAEYGGETRKAESYKKHWRLYDLSYVFSIFVYVATIALFLAVSVSDTVGVRPPLADGWNSLAGVAVVVLALGVGSATFFVMYTLFRRGKAVEYDTIDVLQYELAVAIRHYENNDTYSTLNALEELRETAKNDPPLPAIPLPHSPSPFYHKVVTAIDDYVSAIENADDVSSSLDETFPQFARDLITLLETKQSLYADNWDSKIEYSETYETSYSGVIRQSFADVDFARDPTVVGVFLVATSTIGLTLFWYNENLGVLSVSVMLTCLEVYSTILHNRRDEP